MKIRIEELLLDASLQAQAAFELEGLSTFVIPDTAFVCLRSTDNFLHIQTLFVTESKRRQGIGRGLFKLIEKEASRAGFHLIGLSIDTRHKEPKEALPFAKSLGFKIKESGTGPGHIGLTKALLHDVSNLSDSPAPAEVGA